jgi:hypothetical protein
VTLSSFNLLYVIPVAVVLFAPAVMVFLAARRAVRARARQRVVELPNSHYTSQLVRDSESRHRWQGIELDSIHEINRGEVEQLLARIQISGVESLRPSERTFLDHIAGRLDASEPAQAPSAPPAMDPMGTTPGSAATADGPPAATGDRHEG